LAINQSGQLNGENQPAFDKAVSRRNFMDWIIKGGLLTTLAGMLFPALSYLWPVMRGGPASDSEEVGKVDDIPVWGSKKVILGGSAVLIIRTPDQVKAFSAICTHLGCLVDWNGQKREIACPCHAGFFNLEGQVISGPPPRPLPAHAVNVVDGKIFVKL
jgi:cytochrome b6-f complex iron-sulfur subunit